MTGLQGTQQPTVVIHIDPNQKSSYSLASGVKGLFNGVWSIAKLPINTAKWTVQTAAGAAKWTAQTTAQAVATTTTSALNLGIKVAGAAIEPVISVAKFSAMTTVAATAGTIAYLTATRPQDAKYYVELSYNTTRDYFSRQEVSYTRRWFGPVKTEVLPSDFENDLEAKIPEFKKKYGYLVGMAQDAASKVYNYATGPGSYYEAVSTKIGEGYAAATTQAQTLLDKGAELLTSGKTTLHTAYTFTKDTANDLRAQSEIALTTLSEEVACKSEELVNNAKTALSEGYSLTKIIADDLWIRSEAALTHLSEEGARKREALFNNAKTALSDLWTTGEIALTNFSEEGACKREEFLNNAKAILSDGYAATKNRASGFYSSAKTALNNAYVLTSTQATQFGAEAAVKAINAYSTARQAPGQFISYIGTKLNDGVTGFGSHLNEFGETMSQYLTSETGYEVLEHKITKGDITLGTLGLATVATASVVAAKYILPAFHNRTAVQETKTVEA